MESGVTLEKYSPKAIVVVVVVNYIKSLLRNFYCSRAIRSERGVHEIRVKRMNIDDRRQTNDRPTSGPIHEYWKISNGHISAGALKMLDVKMTDVKLTDQCAGHEIAGQEIAGHKRAAHETDSEAANV